MKISTLLKRTAVVVGALFVFLAWSIYSLDTSIEKQRAAADLEKRAAKLSIELQDASNYLTEQVRSYTQYGENEFYDNYWKEVNETKTREKVVAEFEKLHVPNELLKLIEEANQNSNTLVTLEEKAMDYVESGDLTLARSLVFGGQYERGKELIAEPLNRFNAQLDKWTGSKVKQAEENVMKSYIIMIISAVLVLITIIITFVLLFRKLKPLSSLSAMAQSIAEGNLNVKDIQVKGKDEVAELTQSFNTMALNLKNLLFTVNEASENVAASSDQLLASAAQTNTATQQVTASVDEIASGGESQLQHVQESAMAITEVAAGIQMIADTSASVAESSTDTSIKSQDGQKNINRALERMRTIEENVSKTAHSIKNLDERSKEIENIVIAITTISSQTNLLALNAAIEAARAGEHGKGFAVVADEVRKLAEESNNSAQQITELIKSIQADTISTVDQMDRVTDNVQGGVEIIEHTGRAFNDILKSAQSVASQVQEVSTISEQMAASAQQVSASFETVNSITENASARTQTVAGLAEEQSASMEEITASAETLSKLAHEMQVQLGKFKF
ncbi:methyl-accepting chemotaxis protein [Bacillus salacetis]|uniref:Methyl-accepting chemotaxis protein n=1 Tax=Bacillus salacetis TaxID=2315464 RepID=A0A3A1R785_9BACI|nr:HAMP domain-containing methyl-accepting chemotaxis protein [Bacillus salacetis]RIW39081.1 methyl-accepting chemotaxis protein [Bacillus salacetis]